MRRLICVALLAAPASPALAQEQKAKITMEAAPAVSKEKMICRREVPIGSNIPGKKVCVAKSQLDAQTEAARQTTREMQTSNPGAASGN